MPNKVTKSYTYSKFLVAVLDVVACGGKAGRNSMGIKSREIELREANVLLPRSFEGLDCLVNCSEIPVLADLQLYNWPPLTLSEAPDFEPSG